MALPFPLDLAFVDVSGRTVVAMAGNRIEL